MSERPMACCPSCSEPLVFTFERPGCEFVCVICDRWYGYLQPVGKAPTPELNARHAELRARYLAEREQRRQAAGADERIQ